MKRLFFVAFFLLLPISIVSASTQEYTLDNGMTVLVTPMPSSPMAAINLCVKTGSANEGKYIGSGITHFVEHMIFKGTLRRGPGMVPQEAKALGGSINASTSFDNTDYILSVPKVNVAQAIDLVADMVMNPVFDSVELEKEREVIIKEMHLNHDNPDRRIGEIVYTQAYHIHPYQYPIIGKEDIFKALKREDLLDYHHTLYVPNNMVFSIAGGITADEVLPIIKKVFKDFKARSFPLRHVPQEPEQIFPRRTEVEYPTDLTRLNLSFQGVSLLNQDLYALDVLSMALGQGASSRFYTELYKERRLVESISSGNFTPMDQGLFEISCLLKNQNPQDVIDAVFKMIERVKREGLSLDELLKVKRQVMVDNIYSRQTAEGMADKAAADVVFTGDSHFSDHYADGVKKVTVSDIKRVAARYLTREHLNITILKPVSQKTTAEQIQKSSNNDIKKVVLSNGLTLLLKEDHSLPIVAISAVFNGGMRDETLPLNGLSSLTGVVWAKGLPGQSSSQIEKESESRAVAIDSYSGRNSYVLSLSGLKEDLPFLMDHLEAFLKQPTFPEKEIQMEKDQMRLALLRRKDNILQVSSRVLVETLFETHPFRWDSLGSDATLARVTRRDLMDSFFRTIRGDNGVLAVFGDIDAQSIQKDLTRRLKMLKRGRPLYEVHEEPYPLTMRIKEMEMDKEQALVIFGFRGPSIKDADKESTEVLVNVLCSSLGGRLFKRIRDEFGKSYTVSGNISPALDAGMVMIYALTTNEGVDKVRNIMQEEFDKLRSSFVTPEELADTKNYLISRLSRDMQSIGAQAITRAIDELLGLGLGHVDEYPARINAVTALDVKQAAEKYLDVNHAALVITRTPVKKTGE